jgi:hypothetical protein
LVLLGRVLAPALVWLVSVLHLELIPLAWTFEIRAPKSTAGIVIAKPVRAHARILVLAYSAANGITTVALPHCPEPKSIE